LPSDILPGDLLPDVLLPGDLLPDDLLPGILLPGDLLPGDLLPGFFCLKKKLRKYVIIVLHNLKLDTDIAHIEPLQNK
jgi:hypothetical protein